MAEDFIAGRHGKRTARVLHPLMEPIVADTYGVILYQEQVMQIVSVLGGFSLGEAISCAAPWEKRRQSSLTA